MKSLVDVIVDAIFTPESSYAVVNRGVKMRAEKPVAEVLEVQSADGRRFEVTVHEVRPEGSG